MNMIKNSVQNGYTTKMGQQFNLMCSLQKYFEGGCDMSERYTEIRKNLKEKINGSGECEIETDEEYFYAVGQLVYYFVSLSKSKEKNHSLANPFLVATGNEVIRRRLRQYFMKYNYQINFARQRFNRMYAMVDAYILEKKIDQEYLLGGYIGNNLIYEPRRKQRRKYNMENRVYGVLGISSIMANWNADLPVILKVCLMERYMEVTKHLNTMKKCGIMREKSIIY